MAVLLAAPDSCENVPVHKAQICIWKGVWIKRSIAGIGCTVQPQKQQLAREKVGG